MSTKNISKKVRERIYFGSIKENVEIPNLIEIQNESYKNFLQKDVRPLKRKSIGLQGVFKEIFPISGYDQKVTLDFISYRSTDPKKDQPQSSFDALREGKTYSRPLYVTFSLKDETGVKKQEVFMGDLPMISPQGTMIINGTERVVVSQLHRSPGISFEKTISTNGKDLYSFQIIPDQGNWLETQFDSNDLMYVYLSKRQRKRKFLATTFLRVLGYPTTRDIVKNFYQIEKISLASKVSKSSLVNKVLFEPIENNNSVIVPAYEALTSENIKSIKLLGYKKIEVIDAKENEILLKTLKRDIAVDEESALVDIFSKIRPGDPVSANASRSLLKRLFFDSKRYNLTNVGRYKINQKLGLNLDKTLITGDDFLYAIKYLLNLKKGEGILDDIDHMGSRRIRTLGESLANESRVGLTRMERIVRERMAFLDDEVERITPQKLVNPKVFITVIRDFFARSPMSQFMDQENPLAELAHKRRLSALGPGGLNRERAGFDVRDVHSSHYGRICPIETPEGPNIGLINSLAIYAKINHFGFIETPYKIVKNGKVQDGVEYLMANQEETFYIAQANNPVDKNGKFLNSVVTARYQGEFVEVDGSKVDYIDVSPKQLVSMAAGLIPFLEHDDANRALMGSNMQRQAVPLLQSEAPFVGTGLEKKAAIDSQAVVLSRSAGTVASATAEVIVVTKDGELPVSEKRFLKDFLCVKENIEKGIYIYPLRKFIRSNARTCINQNPIVKKGDKVKKGQIIADGPSSDNGELSLGRNLLVGFMPWNGYNFEDAIVISERLVREDILTSIHIAEYEVVTRDTKLGPEEVTRDIPGISEEALSNLDHNGIVRVGAEVKPGDILVGKITPKSEIELVPEERLLRAIFGEKASNVIDTSLRVKPGSGGIVQDVRILKKGSALILGSGSSNLKKQEQKIEDNYKKRKSKLKEQLTEKLSDVLLGEKVPLDVVNAESGEIIVLANRKITKTLLRKIANAYENIEIDRSPIRNKILEIVERFDPKFEEIQSERLRQVDELESGELVPGVISEVKVYVANKRKISVGDKMVGRHGNKGVIAAIVPDEDMPFLENGTPLDICLNPLGVPSRMNVGQVLETHLGLAAKALGFNIATPVFDGIKEEKIYEYLDKAQNVEGFEWIGVRKTGLYGKSILYDGHTGEPYQQPVTVGYIYMLKLGHLVSDKIHARATGPYSLVTQQPLGGKTQRGGQRLGEMEAWALEAYGAAYTLQEMLTVKSDDISGRKRTYERILRGENTLEAGCPESFNVLTKEIQALGMDIRFLRENEKEEDLIDKLDI